MSWIKIEVQKGNPKKTAKSSVEPIDYEKIREITREVVKEEMKEQQRNQSASLTKEDIQEAVCAGIMQAEVKKEESDRERIKNTKPSRFTIVMIVVYSIIAAIAFLLAAVIATIDIDVSSKIGSCGRLVIIGISYIFVAILQYAVGKNKDKNFTYNMISILFAFISLVFSIIQ